MKKWNNPELKNLELKKTCTEEGCVGEFDATKSLLPDHILFCSKWVSLTDRRCTSDNYGKWGQLWPCPKAPTTPEVPQS